ncbi:PAS domain-containing protein [Pseudorhodoferax sp. Leaf267]|uniref:PAS domain-containing protein n=1 Tax=Pseudorhodoferax sp. Leaf267 TaxID=1736316 RepID=UPI0007003A36|nr:PAS domain-containing protein [Pseudorhodoferax sp. Leaf267]KQP13695.1 hypothetical protein ASF43_17520 [Pseudorhodoferax sp. Leaf267]
MPDAPFDPVVLRLDPATLDDIPLGLLRLSDDERLRYMNQAARDLAGPTIALGMPLSALELLPHSREQLAAQLQQRRDSERGGSYALVLHRADLGANLHMDVSAVPEYDAEGHYIGSIGFLTDTTMQGAQLAVHEAIGVASDWRALLKAVDRHMRELLPFDAIVISLVSEDRSALRVFYEEPPLTQGPAWCWWPMPAFVRADLESLRVTRADDVQLMFATSPYRELADDPITAAWLSLGYRQMLRRPVLRDNRLAAIVTLCRRDDRPFTPSEMARLDQLPIGEAVNMALALDRQGELDFGLQLIGRLGAAAGNLADVARELADGMRANFGWEHVSLFRVNLDEDSISLVHQSAQPDFVLPPDYAQSRQLGLLGQVARSGQPLRRDLVHEDPVYLPGIAGTVSEMCLPVPGQPVRWILNVESSKRAAFAREEEQAVARLLAVAGLILDRTQALQFKATVLDTVADAIIQTSSRGDIQSVNPACERLLARDAASLIGQHLSSLISAPGNEPDPPGFALRLVAMDKLIPGEVELLTGKGEAVPVLLSGESLPRELGGKVYVASDLRPDRAAQRMHTLANVFRQLASEIRLPLALISAHLEELQEALAAQPALAGTLDKARRQLRRADLPLERAVRLATLDQGQALPLQTLSLPELARKLIDELPQAQAKAVRLDSGSGDTLVQAARQEFEFCAASLLAFMLRMKAQCDAVCIHLRREQTREMFSVELVDAQTLQPSSTRLEAKSEHEREFALAEPVITALMRRMGGSFAIDQRAGLRLHLALPVLEPA